MKNYHILNFDMPFIKPNISFVNRHPEDWDTIKIRYTDAISVNGMCYLFEAGFKPHTIVNLFVGTPNGSTTVHTDNSFQTYALNYIWGSTASTMRWFRERPGITARQSYTSANTAYIRYDEDQVELIEELVIPNNTLLLVRIDIPHQVINLTSDKRYCLSVRGTPELSWDDAVNHFRPYILEES